MLNKTKKLTLVSWILPTLILLPTMITKAQAQQSELTLVVFRVGVNEGALANIREVSIVYQGAKSHGHGTSEHLAWLRKHSPRASGRMRVLSMRGYTGNSAWASQLTPTCEKPKALDVSEDWWNKARRERCLAAFHLAQALVEGRVKDKPCKSVDGREIETWGSPTLDHARAVRLGMVQHECVGVLNEGWSWPTKTVPAYLAAAHRVR